MIKKSFSSITLPNVFLVILGIVYFFTAVSFIFKSGWEICDANTHACSMSILAYHAHDAFWHLAISEVAFRSFPPLHPIFSGDLLTHYNYLYDFLIYLFSRFTGVSTLHSYFHVFPVLIAIFYIIAVWRIVKTLCHDTWAKIFTALFLFLGNSFAFIMTYFTFGSLMGSSLRGFPIVLSIQPTTMFLNSQFALSLPLILLAILFINSKSLTHPILRSTVLSLLIIILTLLKAYAGITLVVYCLCFYTLKFYKKPNIYSLFYIFTSICSFALVSLAFGGGKGAFSYDPLAFIRSLFDDPNHFFRIDIALARITLESSGRFSPRLVLFYGSGIFLFYLINFGGRLVFLFQALYLFRKRSIDPHTFSLVITIISLSIVPLFLVQKGDFFNTMQFLYYGVFLSSLIAGSVYASIKSPAIKVICIITIFITICIPLVDQWTFASRRDFTIISSDFMQISKILKNEPDGTVSLFGAIPSDGRITAFSGKQLTIGDLPVLTNTFVDYRNRLSSTIQNKYSSFADYIFVDKSLSNDWTILLKGKLKISENKSYILYKNTHPE